jgi:hypothetical protein
LGYLEQIYLVAVWPVVEFCEMDLKTSELIKKLGFALRMDGMSN